MMNREETELERVRRQRDLYRRLLDLGGQDELELFLNGALRLVVEMTGADQGYLELSDLAEEDQAAWSMAHSMTESEVDKIRTHISRGIIAEALATGETIATNSALLDARFSERRSVQAAQIGAVICAPVGGRAGLGAVYLQRAKSKGLFSTEDRESVEIFAKHFAPFADRLVARSHTVDATDSTRELRKRYRLEGIVGRSPALAQALEQAMLAAPLDVNVLLTGDSGTGKSQLARAIHENSARSAGPFIALNCAALPEALIENELFGAKAGAHNVANRDIPGKVEAAEGGTLLLDEIGDLPLGAQAKLLQLLQSREYFPLGGTQAISADIRVIAATNANLEERASQKLFREDLFFRLHVLPVRLPSLAERRGDLRELAQMACARAIEQNRLPNLELSTAALQAIESAEWPGNVRQLESAIVAAAIRAAGQGTGDVQANHVFPSRGDPIEGSTAHVGDISFQEATRLFQRDLLARILSETDWNVSETARRLDLARSHVYKLIDGFGFKRKNR